MRNTSKAGVITGASSGFGEGAVKAFANKGYRIWGTMPDTEGRIVEKKTALEAYSAMRPALILNRQPGYQVADKINFPNASQQNALFLIFVGQWKHYSLTTAKRSFHSNLFCSVSRVRNFYCPETPRGQEMAR